MFNQLLVGTSGGILGYFCKVSVETEKRELGSGCILGIISSTPNSKKSVKFMLVG